MGSVDRSDRALAVAGGAAVVAASIAASVAQRTAPTANFISELGVPGRPLARTFRTALAMAGLTGLRLGLGRRSHARGAALATAGACLVVTAAVPSSPGCPIPLLDGKVPRRDWVHVPAAMAAFHLVPVAARSRLRALLTLNLVALGPPTLLDPHGPVTALLQRTMTALAAVTLATWVPPPAGR
jgi:hypothetical protein